MSIPLRLLISMLILALAGCTTSTTSPEVSVQAAPPATNVCTGIAGCQRVANVDVDGDGRADQVAVASNKIASGGSITVRVRTAKHHTLQTTGRHVYWFDKPYFGAAALDGQPGAELVVGDTMGAHTQQFRVITYRKGRLVTLKAPPLAWTKKGMSQATSRWWIDGSYSFNIGVYRSVSAKHVVTLTLKSLERAEHGHVGHTTRYRWRSGGWVKVSAATVRVRSDQKAFATGGWHVQGLRRFR